MKPNLKYCAQHYLRQWITDEKRLHEALNSEDRETILFGLSDAVRFFIVARNLPRKYDVEIGLKRYEPLLNAFQAFTAECSPSNADFIDNVDQFKKELSSLYGGRNLISIASKLLWLRYRNPFIIYDSRVRTALGVRPGNYSEFVKVWLSHYQHLESEIAEVCRSLPKLQHYFFPFADDSEQVAQAICSESWFIEGCLIYISGTWEDGTNKNLLKEIGQDNVLK